MAPGDVRRVAGSVLKPEQRRCFCWQDNGEITQLCRRYRSDWRVSTVAHGRSKQSGTRAPDNASGEQTATATGSARRASSVSLPAGAAMVATGREDQHACAGRCQQTEYRQSRQFGQKFFSPAPASDAGLLAHSNSATVPTPRCITTNVTNGRHAHCTGRQLIGA